MPKPAWKTCEICRDLPEFCDADQIKGEELPAAVYRLELCGNLRRCPVCHTFYDYDDGNDPHHYMPDDQWVSRITSDFGRVRHKLVIRTSGSFAETAKRWLQDLDADMAQ